MGKNNKPVAPVDVINLDSVDQSPVVETTITSESQKPKMVKGVIANCKKLNIRKEPDVSAEPVVILDEGTELRVNMSESSDEWLKVSTRNKKSGYCMAKFVTINN